ncbi:beta-lactamase-like protein [Mariannaea sp. PMI_226]|nr:beta-lactamase-like protein [Mariannaea sp. PMI_226]
MCNTSRTKRSNENFFSCKRLNKSTFMVTENDRYGEFPQIFVKVYPSAVAVIDTGCGGDPNNTQVSLVAFLETQPIAENGNAPINAHKKPYVVISTHCHYDHIGGMSDFANRPDCTIWASSHDKSFLRPGALPKNSLCDNVGMETPDYTITNWVGDGQTIMTHSGQDLNLTIYHTPGHTPDHVAIWDAEERHLFVGDTLYRQAPVFFLYGGSVLAYSETIGRLRKMVNGWNQELGMFYYFIPVAKVLDY